MKLNSLAVSLLLTAITLPAIAGPHIEFDKTIFDVGGVCEGKKTQVAFEFKNSGDEELEIKGVDASCDCTVSKSAATKVAPGESSKIEISFTSSGTGGEFEKSVTVRSNDPETPAARLKIQGKIIPIATLSPERLNFGTLAIGSKKEIDLIVTPSTAEGFKITKTESRKGHVTVQEITKAEDGKGSYRLRLLLQAGDAAGRVLDRLIIHTDLPGDPIVGFLVFGNVEGKQSDGGSKSDSNSIADRIHNDCGRRHRTSHQCLKT